MQNSAPLAFLDVATMVAYSTGFAPLGLGLTLASFVLRSVSNGDKPEDPLADIETALEDIKVQIKTLIEKDHQDLKDFLTVFEIMEKNFDEYAKKSSSEDALYDYIHKEILPEAENQITNTLSFYAKIINFKNKDEFKKPKTYANQDNYDNALKMYGLLCVCMSLYVSYLKTCIIWLNLEPSKKPGKYSETAEKIDSNKTLAERLYFRLGLLIKQAKKISETDTKETDPSLSMIFENIVANRLASISEVKRETNYETFLNYMVSKEVYRDIKKLGDPNTRSDCRIGQLTRALPNLPGRRQETAVIHEVVAGKDVSYIKGKEEKYQSFRDFTGFFGRYPENMHTYYTFYDSASNESELEHRFLLDYDGHSLSFAPGRRTKLIEIHEISRKEECEIYKINYKRRTEANLRKLSPQYLIQGWEIIYSDLAKFIPLAITPFRSMHTIRSSICLEPIQAVDSSDMAAGDKVIYGIAFYRNEIISPIGPLNPTSQISYLEEATVGNANKTGFLIKGLENCFRGLSRGQVDGIILYRQIKSQNKEKFSDPIIIDKLSIDDLQAFDYEVPDYGLSLLDLKPNVEQMVINAVESQFSTIDLNDIDKIEYGIAFYRNQLMGPIEWCEKEVQPKKNVGFELSNLNTCFHVKESQEKNRQLVEGIVIFYRLYNKRGFYSDETLVKKLSLNDLEKLNFTFIDDCAVSLSDAPDIDGIKIKSISDSASLSENTYKNIGGMTILIEVADRVSYGISLFREYPPLSAPICLESPTTWLMPLKVKGQKISGFQIQNLDAFLGKDNRLSITGVAVYRETILAKAQQNKSNEIPGLIYREIPSASGHCLFHAVALCIGKEKSALQDDVAHHLGLYKSAYSQLLILPVGSPIENYIKALKDGNEWEAHIEIEILMKYLDRPIIVIDPDCTIKNKDVLERGLKSEPIFVYHNGNNHYDAYIRKEGTATTVDIINFLKSNESIRKVEETYFYYEQLKASNFVLIDDTLSGNIKLGKSVTEKLPSVPHNTLFTISNAQSNNPKIQQGIAEALDKYDRIVLNANRQRVADEISREEKITSYNKRIEIYRQLLSSPSMSKPSSPSQLSQKKQVEDMLISLTVERDACERYLSRYTGAINAANEELKKTPIFLKEAAEQHKLAQIRAAREKYNRDVEIAKSFGATDKAKAVEVSRIATLELVAVERFAQQEYYSAIRDIENAKIEVVARIEQQNAQSSEKEASTHVATQKAIS